ncbi:hypothetical protein BU25DRAFT_414493 [Macroventuria anomochaeta]|uniref:Uncharacterized protein n=1 Tax=Macroventuria anomochaeta TaxID=301207 RepID=A0ACB6RMH4_9PLEO|nr:uncharacterized protein BU25DRAFT_414493 [Macroventuria anomochaeta]KAF2623226.1 hypothetical protein BU25DRAFT_414493 [Macroventuria anomochaeta]
MRVGCSATATGFLHACLLGLTSSCYNLFSVHALSFEHSKSGFRKDRTCKHSGISTVLALTTRTIFATQMSVITSIIAATTSVVLQLTTIYSTSLVPTTFTLTSTAFSVLDRGLTTTIFTGRTVTSTVTANLLNLPIRAEPTQTLPTEVKA